MEKPLNQWLAFIDMERSDLLQMAKEKNEVIRDAICEHEYLTGDEAVQRMEWIKLRNEMEENSIKEIEREEGRKEEKIKIAKKLIELKIPIEQIEEATGLTEEEIKNI